MPCVNRARMSPGKTVSTQTSQWRPSDVLRIHPSSSNARSEGRVTGGQSTRYHVVWVFLSFVAGIAVTISAPLLFRSVAERWFFPVQYREIGRVTSPDGAVDAVMEEGNCGAPCSFVYYVSIVPKGSAGLNDPAQQVFIADDVVNARIRWSEPNLLDIGYDKALIDSFHNVAYPFARSGNADSWRDEVEVRLAPSSARFSYLKDATAPVHTSQPGQ